FFEAEDGIRDFHVTGVQTCALPISSALVLFIFIQFSFFMADRAYGPVWNNIVILLGIAYYFFCALVFRKEFFHRKSIPGLFLYKIGRASCRDRVKDVGWMVAV